MSKRKITVLSEKPADMFAMSVSKGKTFDQCKAKYKFSYIEKLPRKDWDFHIFGKFLHEVLENFHKGIIEKPGRAKKWRAYLSASWEDARLYWADQMTAEQFVEAKEIIDEYQRLLEEEGVPNVTAVEKVFYIDIDGKVLLNGFIDRVQIDPDEMIHVIDYKTTKDKRYLKDFFQLRTYAYALMLADPKLERVRASFSLLRHGFDMLTEEYTRKDMKEIEDAFLRYTKDIAEERLWRANPQFLCKFCDFVDHCQEGKKFLIKRGYIEDDSPGYGLTAW